jgi:hypothetical protein
VKPLLITRHELRVTRHTSRVKTYVIKMTETQELSTPQGPDAPKKTRKAPKKAAAKKIRTFPSNPEVNKNFDFQDLNLKLIVEKHERLVGTPSELEKFQTSSNDFNCTLRLNESDGYVFTTSLTPGVKKVVEFDQSFVKVTKQVKEELYRFQWWSSGILSDPRYFNFTQTHSHS